MTLIETDEVTKMESASMLPGAKYWVNDNDNSCHSRIKLS